MKNGEKVCDYHSGFTQVPIQIHPAVIHLQDTYHGHVAVQRGMQGVTGHQHGDRLTITLGVKTQQPRTAAVQNTTALQRRFLAHLADHFVSCRPH